MFIKSSAGKYVRCDILYNNILRPDTSQRIVWPVGVPCLPNEVSNHKFITCNSYLFSTATIFDWTRLIITLHVVANLSFIFVWLVATSVLVRSLFQKNSTCYCVCVWVIECLLFCVSSCSSNFVSLNVRVEFYVSKPVNIIVCRLVSISMCLIVCN